MSLKKAIPLAATYKATTSVTALLSIMLPLKVIAKNPFFSVWLWLRWSNNLKVYTGYEPYYQEIMPSPSFIINVRTLDSFYRTRGTRMNTWF